ncbi:hypothetical protein DFH28DRAFT_979861 [Melampsora americana]|nr:hypothetical protein DFH28DRAFT_979861 [Melampsora americana]
MSEAASSSSNLTIPDRLQNCKVCNQEKSIYTCPACSIKTCSLNCSNQHKQTQNCNGKRNRVNHIPINKYTWGTLMQDYSYLEEVNRVLDSTRKSSGSIDGSRLNSKRDGLVKNAAKESVRLVLMAEGMSRRKLNTTTFNHKKRCMQWTVEIIFRCKTSTKDDHNLSRHISHQVLSSTSLIDLLTQSLGSKKLKVDQSFREDLLNHLSKPNSHDQTSETQNPFVLALLLDPSTTSPNLETSTNTTPASHSKRHYHLLEPETTLSDALSGSTIVEWPMIEVWNHPEWSEQLTSDLAQIVPKTTPVATRQSDSGWANKRTRISADTLSTDDPVTDVHLADGNTIKPVAESGPLVDYDSGENESDCN